MAYIISFGPNTDFSSNFFARDGIFNLLFNLGGGLPPECLTEREIALLVAEYGPDWKKDMGYTEPSQQFLKMEEMERQPPLVVAPRRVQKGRPRRTREREVSPKRPQSKHRPQNAKTVKPCTNGCGKEGSVLPAGDFLGTKRLCPECYNEKYPSPASAANAAQSK